MCHRVAVMVAVEDLQHSQVDTDSANSPCFQDNSCPMIHPYRRLPTRQLPSIFRCE